MRLPRSARNDTFALKFIIKEGKGAWLLITREDRRLAVLVWGK
jgi:hypothetical protein